jgi:hypothetical protein
MPEKSGCSVDDDWAALVPASNDTTIAATPMNAARPDFE